jgi:hypothetical protein
VGVEVGKMGIRCEIWSLSRPPSFLVGVPLFLFFNSPTLGLPRLARAAACRLVDEEEMVGDGVRFAATRTHKAC